MFRHPEDHNSRRIRNADKDFTKKAYFKNIKLPFKIRDSHRIDKKNYIGISGFGCGPVNILFMYQKKIMLRKTC